MSKTIPFDIKYRPQIESGEMKVQTRDGRPARKVTWDLMCDSYREGEERYLETSIKS